MSRWLGGRGGWGHWQHGDCCTHARCWPGEPASPGCAAGRLGPPSGLTLSAMRPASIRSMRRREEGLFSHCSHDAMVLVSVSWPGPEGSRCVAADQEGGSGGGCSGGRCGVGRGHHSPPPPAAAAAAAELASRSVTRSLSSTTACLRASTPAGTMLTYRRHTLQQQRPNGGDRKSQGGGGG